MDKIYVLCICEGEFIEPVLAGSQEFCIQMGEDWLTTFLNDIGIEREDYDSLRQFVNIYYTVNQVPVSNKDQK